VIPVKDVIPPRTTPWAALTLLALGLVEFGVERWLALPTRQSTASLIANGTALWLFADNVEDRLGRRRFLACYVGSGLMGAAAAARVAEWIAWPVILSSSEVAGLLGAYFVLFPHSRVLMFFPLPLELFEAPALFFLSTFVIVHLPFGIAALVEVAAGLIAGAALCVALKKPVVW
jgi:membrane associated rhomboid family serine protease